jgi:hypothetical protein
LHGPNALLRLFEQTFGTVALYGPARPDLQQRALDAQAEEIDRLKALLARLKAEVSELHYRNCCQLQRRNSELEA